MPDWRPAPPGNRDRHPDRRARAPHRRQDATWLRAYTRASGTLRDAVIRPRDGPRRRKDQTSLTATSPAPLVSIIAPTYNHAPISVDVSRASLPKLSRAGNRSSLTTARLTEQPRSSVASRTHEFAMSLNATVGSRVWGARTTWPSGWRVGSMSRYSRGTTSGHRTSSRGNSRHSRNPEVVLSWGSRRRLITAGVARRLRPGRGKGPQASAPDCGPDGPAAARGELHTRVHGGMSNERPACSRWLSSA